jgi:hypothetical protein
MDVIKIEDVWYTASEIIAYKKKADEYDSLKATADDFERLISKLKERIAERDISLTKVREWFCNLDWTDSNTATVTIEREFASEFLEELGLEGLSTSWSASVIIYATINGLQANNAATARELITDNIEVNFGEDADIWIEDVHVNELEQERS